MRIRSGIILIEENNLALIERHRAGLHYFAFPGGGMDEGETRNKPPSVKPKRNWAYR